MRNARGLAIDQLHHHRAGFIAVDRFAETCVALCVLPIRAHHCVRIDCAAPSQREMHEDTGCQCRERLSFLRDLTKAQRVHRRQSEDFITSDATEGGRL
jgi:hypothetical protein